MRGWLDDYDYNLALTDAANDPALSDRRRMLAAVGLREGLDGGYYEAQALAGAALALAAADNGGGLGEKARAEAALDALLAADAHGYQRALYAQVSDYPSADAAADLSWVARLMSERAGMYRIVSAAGAQAVVPGR